MKPRSAITIFLSLVATAFIAKYAYEIATTGQLEISGPKGALMLIKDDALHTGRKLGKTKATARLKPGNYTVAAELGDQATKQVIKIDRGGKTSVTLELKELIAPTKLADYTGRSIVESGGNLRFLNAPANQLAQLPKGAHEASRYLPELYPLSNMQWIDFDHGLASDRAGNLWVVSGDSSKRLNSNGLDSSEITSPSLNAVGQLSFVAKGKLYFYDSLNAAPKEVYDTKQTNARAALAPDGHVFIYYDTAESPDSGGVSNQLASLIVDPGDRSAQPFSADGVIEYATWAPDGKHLFYRTEAGSFIYDFGAKRSIQSSTVRSDAQSVTWVDNNRFGSLHDGFIDVFTLNDQTTRRAAKLSGRLDHQNPLDQGAAGSLLFGTDATAVGSVGAIYRLELTNF